jgi:hypothetical protein
MFQAYLPIITQYYLTRVCMCVCVCVCVFIFKHTPVLGYTCHKFFVMLCMLVRPTTLYYYNGLQQYKNVIVELYT